MNFDHIEHFDRKVLLWIRLIHTAYAFVGIVLAIDFLGALAWAWSGQVPEGNFYIGTISIHLLRLVIK